MGRPKDPLTPYRMRALKGGKDGSITYAVTYLGGRSVNGRRSSNIAFWGHLTEGLCFEPMLRFQLLPDSEKRKYIFPPEWDISRAFETVYTRKEPGVVHDGDDMIRIYGDALLLDRLADRYGVKEDLTAVFGEETAGKIISVACYLILVDKTLAHYESVARVRWFPCTEGLGAASITLLSQSITQEQIGRFKKLRVARAGEGCQWFGIDSTSITSYAKGIGDVTWGHNKEGDKARQLNMMVVYSFTSGLPAHYMKLAGGLPDSRSLRLLREELLSAGTPPAGYIFDRAYLTDENLDYVVPMGLKCIFMARYDRNVIKEAIADAGRDERIVREGEFIKDEECYAMEYVFPYSYKEEGSGPGRGESLPQRLIVIFRPDVKGEETIAISKDIADLSASAEGHMKDGVPVDDALRRRYARFLDASYDEAGRITGFSVPDSRRAEAFARCGFHAFVCCNMPKDEYPASEVLRWYSKRDVQEKTFCYMKSWQQGRRLRASTEGSVTGRLFILFVALILNSALHVEYGRSQWLKENYLSPWDVLDSLMCVRLHEYRGRTPKVSEFFGEALDIFDELGLEVPAGCRPKSRMKPKKPLTKAQKMGKRKSGSLH